MDADALKAWREALGWKQAQAAEALGVSLATYQSAETGRRTVSRTMDLACRWLEHEAGLGAAPAAAPEPRPDMGPILDELAELHADMNRAWERLAEYGERLSELGKGVLPATIRDDIVRRYEYHAQQQQQRIQARTLTDDERREADKARRAIAKARSLAQGEPWE